MRCVGGQDALHGRIDLDETGDDGTMRHESKGRWCFCWPVDSKGAETGDKYLHQAGRNLLA